MSPRPDELKDKFLENSEFLHGIAYNVSDGPYKCSRQVAQLNPNSIYSIQINNDIIVEDSYSTNEIDARYVHLGWPTPSSLRARPWGILYPETRTSSSSGTWVSRRMIVHRWIIDISIEDLIPLDLFVEAVESALKRSTTFDRIQALREVFEVWGGMVALSAVVGGSLAATGVLAPGQTLTGSPSSFRPPDRGVNVTQLVDQSLDITGNFEKRFESSVQGAYPDAFAKNGFNAWLNDITNLDNSPTWVVSKVYRAVSTVEILPKELRQRVNRLLSYATIVSFSPPLGASIPFGFDGAALGLKNIKRIDLWLDGLTLRDFAVVYEDATQIGPHEYGKGKPASKDFPLTPGEFITEVFVWSTATGVNALQFVKNTYQISPYYGVQASGNPTILTAGGRALLGFSGTSNSGGISQARAVWRGDVRVDEYRSIATDTVGIVSNEVIFNDYSFLGDPATARISKIQYRTPAQAATGLRITYTSNQDGTPVHQDSPVHGSEVGSSETWVLGDDEYITALNTRVSGAVVYQIEFVTNKGNSRKFGQEAGDKFPLKPPQEGMVLYYLVGRSAVHIQSLTAVWGARPLSA